MANDGKDFEIGFRKPPKANQFAKGESGNPQGRPKGSKSLATIVLQESRRFVRINGSRGPRKVTIAHAAMMLLANKAAQGDHKAQREFFALIQRSEESSASSTAPLNFNELDKKTLEGMRQRMAEAATKASQATEKPE